MAAPDITNVHWTQGRLAFAGTILGLTKSIRLVKRVRSYQLTMEEYGSEGGDVVELGVDWACVALITEWSAALAKVFGSMTGEVMSAPGITPGAMGSARSGSLVFTPDDTDDEGFTLKRAIPQLDAAEALNFDIMDPLAVGVVFVGIRDASDDTLTIGT